MCNINLEYITFMSVNPLPARLHPDIAEFIEEKVELQQIVDHFGSPTHVVFPHLLTENAHSFRKVLQKHGQNEASILFATKVNKAEAFLEEAANSLVGIDASSLQELQAALAHGIPGDQISISGPAKNKALQVLGIRVGSTFAIDDTGEFRQIIAISKELQSENKIPATIRLNGGSKAFTRFGMNDDELPELIDALSEQECPMQLQGFSFHLSGYSPDERVTALQHSIGVLQQARSRGLSCNTINIGGGYAVQYVDEDDWKRFLSERDESSYLSGRPKIDLYPHAGEVTGVAALDTILSARTNTHQTIAALLKDSGIRLAIEPGRSLVDQAGITCMQVKNVKKASDGTFIVEVEANINHLSEQWFNADFCVDPIHIASGEHSDEPVEASVVGNTCLEIDVLSWRKIGFLRMPRAGDLLVYPNTAGYQMDSNESEFHRIPLPEKLVAFKKNDTWKYIPDSRYSFADTLS